MYQLELITGLTLHKIGILSKTMKLLDELYYFCIMIFAQNAFNFLPGYYSYIDLYDL